MRHKQENQHMYDLRAESYFGSNLSDHLAAHLLGSDSRLAVTYPSVQDMFLGYKRCAQVWLPTLYSHDYIQ